MACPSEGQDYRFESCWVRHFLLCMGADKMRFVFCALVVAFLLGGCNSVQIKPNTLDVNEIFYIDRGGDQIQHAIKSVMEKRNYNFTVGQKRATIKSTYITSGKNEPNAPIATTDKARYIVQIDESVTKFSRFGAHLMVFGGGSLIYQSPTMNLDKNCWDGLDTDVLTVL